MYRLIALAYVAALLFVSPANASARPRINLDKAEHAVTEYASDFNPPDPEDYDPDAIHSTGMEIIGCDVETRYRVICDADLEWEDGGVDEIVLNVIVTRRGNYIVSING